MLDVLLRNGQPALRMLARKASSSSLAFSPSCKKNTLMLASCHSGCPCRMYASKIIKLELLASSGLIHKWMSCLLPNFLPLLRAMPSPVPPPPAT